jgi:cytochrome c peroxidase
MRLQGLLKLLVLGLVSMAPPGLAADAKKDLIPDRYLLVSFQRLPARFEDPKNPLTPEKVELGRMLFSEPRLSKNHDLACISCHNLTRFYGADPIPVSPGHRGRAGTRNAPTVYNAAGNFVQFWDGRAPNVEEQAKGPLLNPVEMAMPSPARVVETLESIPGYVTLFRKAFPREAKPITFDNVARAIGAFERQLATPSRFDRFLGGEEDALTDDEKRGLQKFLEVGCDTCHKGQGVGGDLIQPLGVVYPYPTKDQGRYEHTKLPADRGMFRVASLRNVARTSPYFHDGSIRDLPTAVRTMALHQLGKRLSDADVNLIVTFLGSLTGELPGSNLLARPQLPPSGPKTPAPDPT